MPLPLHPRPLNPNQPPHPPKFLNELGALADINQRLADLEHAIQEMGRFLMHIEGRLKFGIENTLSKQLTSVDSELTGWLAKVNSAIGYQSQSFQVEAAGLMVEGR